MNIIVLSGKMGSGKDYVADKLTAHLESQDLKVERIAFADPVRDELDQIANLIKCFNTPKEIAKEMGVSVPEIRHVISLFDEEPTFSRPDFTMDDRPSKYRELMQYWGTDVRRARNPEYWVNKAISTLKEIAPFTDVAIVTDARFANEVRGMLTLKNVFTVRLNADEELREERVLNRDGDAPTVSELNHSSENALDDGDSELMKHFDAIMFSTGNNGDELAEEIIREYEKSQSDDEIEEKEEAFL